MTSIRITYSTLRDSLHARGTLTVLDALAALSDHISRVDINNPALTALEAAKSAYVAHAAKPEQPTHRSVEYYRMWDDKTWDTELIEIPYETSEEGIAEAVQWAVSAISWGEDGPPMFVGVYHIPDEEEEFASETCATCMGPLDSDGDCPRKSCWG